MLFQTTFHLSNEPLPLSKITCPNQLTPPSDGTSTNLHHIWDTNMPEKLVGGYTLTDASSWASDLTTQIKTGTYKSQKDSWLSGIDLSDPVTTSMGWASDSNAFVCSTALKGGVSAVSGKELDGSYYSTAIPVIELQIAKGNSICPESRMQNREEKPLLLSLCLLPYL